MNTRTAKIERKTRETDIAVAINLDGSGQLAIETGIPFFNHMLELFGKHALIDLTIRAKGDIEVDYHHTVEDVGIVLGEALNKALGDRCGICRYGWALLPMDETLSRVALDLGGRPYLVYDVPHPQTMIRDFELGMIKHFFRSFAETSRMNLHISNLYGEDPHHVYESLFKGVAKALLAASTRDARVVGVPSSKGTL